MLYTFWYNVQFTGIQLHCFGFKFDEQRSFDDQKEFIRVRVIMPHKIPVNFCNLDLIIVQFTDDFWRPVF